jgi:hypothetical protein
LRTLHGHGQNAVSAYSELAIAGPDREFAEPIIDVSAAGNEIVDMENGKVVADALQFPKTQLPNQLNGSK